MNNNEVRQPNFANGIGVLNYTIQNKSIGISEFYLPNVPNIPTVSAGINQPDTVSGYYDSAFGWLYGGNNINFTINHLDRIFR